MNGRAGSDRLQTSMKGVTAHLWMLPVGLVSAVLALCPLPFGSADEIWVLLWTVPLALSLSALSLVNLRRGHLVILWPALGLFLAVILAVWLQTVPNPLGVSPHPTWSETGAILGRPLAGTVSVDPAASRAALSRPTLLVLAFLCGLAAALTRLGAKIVFHTAAVAGAAYALYGLVSFGIDPEMLLGTEKVAYLDDLTSTFVNRNTAGTFFGVVLILWSVLVLSAYDKRVPRGSASLRDWAAAILDSPPPGLLVAIACWFTTFAALMMTRSRAAILLSLVCLGVTAVLLLRHRLALRAGPLLAVGAAILVGGIGLELFGGGAAGRFGAQGLADQGRVSAYAAALGIVRAFPILGTGLGTFTDVFPAFRTGDMITTGTWDRAHNTPLEIAVELGLPIALATVALWVFGLGRLLRGGLRRRRDAEYPIAAFGIGCLGSLHALVDFSPQVPGFAVMWFALLGAGLAQAEPRDDGSESTAERGRSGSGRPGLARMGTKAAFVALAAGALLSTLSRLPAEFEADPVVSLATRIVAGQDFEQDALDRYEAHLRRVEADPGCGPLRPAVALIRAYQVQQAASTNDLPRALAYVDPALRDLREKLACAPQDGLSWFTLFTLEASMRGRVSTDFPSLLMSYRIAPYEGRIMRMRSQVGTALLEAANPDFAERIRAEFVALARDDPRGAASLIAGAGEPLRGTLLELVKKVDLEKRKGIARQLDSEDLDIIVPGVAPPRSR